MTAKTAALTSMVARIQAQQFDMRASGHSAWQFEAAPNALTLTGPWTSNFAATSTFGAMSGVKGSYNEDDGCNGLLIRSALAARAAKAAGRIMGAIAGGAAANRTLGTDISSTSPTRR